MFVWFVVKFLQILWVKFRARGWRLLASLVNAKGAVKGKARKQQRFEQSRINAAAGT
jgi:hypothetical protein